MSEIKQEAIDHYERMIAWVEKKTSKKVWLSNMQHEIGEDWFSKYCSYCAKYKNFKCPLSGYKEKCYQGQYNYCCGGLWVHLNYAKTWKGWATAAKKVLDYIKENG